MFFVTKHICLIAQIIYQASVAEAKCMILQKPSKHLSARLVFAKERSLFKTYVFYCSDCTNLNFYEGFLMVLTQLILDDFTMSFNNCAQSWRLHYVFMMLSFSNWHKHIMKPPTLSAIVNKDITKHQMLKVSLAGLSVLRLFRLFLVLGRIDARLVFLFASRVFVGGL